LLFREMCRVVLLGIILLGMQRGKECQPMAIGLLMEFPGMGQEQYDAVLDELELGGLMPAGGISHIAGPTETGWRMVEVWESQEAFDLFFRDRLHPSTAPRWDRAATGGCLAGVQHPYASPPIVGGDRLLGPGPLIGAPAFTLRR
jgi:hypothetical protein